MSEKPFFTSKISVIMVANLWRTGDRIKNEKAFKRAVASFINQVHKYCELIIVSESCTRTKILYDKLYKDNCDIKLVETGLPDGSGRLKQIGIEACTGDIVTYLRFNDYITPTHLSSLCYGFDMSEKDWVFYSDYLSTGIKKISNSKRRDVRLKEGYISSSAFSHKKHLAASWDNLNGPDADWQFIKQLMDRSKNYSAIHGLGYVVCKSSKINPK